MRTWREGRRNGTHDKGRGAAYIAQRSAADVVVAFGAAVAEADNRSTAVSLGPDWLTAAYTAGWMKVQRKGGRGTVRLRTYISGVAHPSLRLSGAGTAIA